jgi:hypothetical protein
MVKFDERNDTDLKYSFTDFDKRIAGVFETACKNLFESVKNTILEDCKTLRAIAEEVALKDERYVDGEDFQKNLSEKFGIYAGEGQMEMAESVFARSFSDFISGFYKKCCFDHDFMKAVQTLGTEGRDKIEQKLSELGNYTKLNLEFHNAFLTFEDILLFDDRSVQKILREVHQEDLAVALKIASDELKEKIFSNMSRRAQAYIKEDMEFLGPVLKSDVYERQKKIITVAENLLSCHELRRTDEWA